MEALDLLEKRIEAVESQVLSKDKNVNTKTQPVTDLLTETQTMISSALSCRESITSLLQNMNLINDYLDPHNGENELEIEAKKHYLLEIYPELKETAQAIKTFENLIAFSASESIVKVTELSSKLEELTSTNLDVYEENKKVTQNVLNALQQYNNISNSIMVLFTQLDKALTELEFAGNQQNLTDD